MAAMKTPSYNLEQKLLTQNFELIFGMDEVGRGCFAGPLVAAAVAFENEFTWFSDLNDSKLLSAKKREQLSKLILANAISLIEVIQLDEINQLGIGKCNQLIFERLTQKISNQHQERMIKFLIDGRGINRNNNLEYIIKGDSKVISIAAASIVAKVYRDKLMQKLDAKYPNYNFAQNKGYGTKFHRLAINKLGLCAIHRKSFDLRKFL
jgi:ribonuclease HII